MGRIISIANQKGGVGKTTTAINLAASIALAGEDILIVDTDPQCNSTSGVGIDKRHITKGIYDVYTSKYAIADTIAATPFEHLFIVPCTVDLLAVEIELVSKKRREWVLSDALNSIRHQYKYILIDCPPSLGLLTLNALTASDSVIIPVQCEYYALEGLSMLTRTISLVQKSFNPSLSIEGILLTMYDMRNSLSAQVAAEVRTHFNEKVYTTIIPRNVTLAESPGHSKPALHYDVRSKGAQAYLALAREVLVE
ncbi:ParA family protein [Candidatus Magnetominusculus xianensis]|uniref:Sporulation initiation inhibitor protein soj n=1 Tax=Candidatus Magnetominusculus xianensis TaxID=1748249 RepID=A0ABR5SGP1_9BACT|nr:AAA family ATPase [Candidatus Magnetominusculus xianensis]KWT85579.1 sporulation initiation inhibitor protein soj [Candidatus Magnetominusculus xianensis]MBF0404190.1 ParA family protein [Nitrospirota bacterium]